MSGSYTNFTSSHCSVHCYSPESEIVLSILAGIALIARHRLLHLETRNDSATFIQGIVAINTLPDSQGMPSAHPESLSTTRVDARRDRFSISTGRLVERLPESFQLGA